MDDEDLHDAPLSIQDFDFPVLRNILSFLSTVADLHHCEQTCKLLRAAVSDDKLWFTCFFENPTKQKSHLLNAFAEDARLPTYRQKASMVFAHKHTKSQGKKTDNILLTAMSAQNNNDDGVACDRWKEIFGLVLQRYLPERLTCHHKYFLRGDTMHYLLEYLQTYLVLSFDGANVISLSRARPDDKVYPAITPHDLAVQEALGQARTYPLEAGRFMKKCEGIPSEKIEFANSLLTLATRDRIVRGAAFRAGVPKIVNEVYEIVWAAVVDLIPALIRPVCERLVHLSKCNNLTTPLSLLNGNQERRLLKDGKTIFDVPPLSMKLAPCTCACGHGEFDLVHTLVSGLIAEFAADVLPVFPAKVTFGWLCSSNSNIEDEIAAAEALYAVEEASDEAEAVSTTSSWDFDSDEDEWTDEDSEEEEQ